MNTLSLPRPREARITLPAKPAAFGKIVHNEARLAWRRPIGMIGGVGLPVVLLVIFGKLSKFQQASASLGGLTPFDVYVPILIVLGLAFIALLGLPMPLTSHRQLGVLRRLSTTPVPPSWLLAAEFLVQSCVALVTVLVVLVTSVTAFGLATPKNLGGLLLATLLSIAALFGMGLLVAAAAKTANGASVIGRVTLFPLMFFAGLWLPREEMPAILQTISDYTPLGAAVEAMQYSMQQGFPPVAPLLVLAGYAVGFGFLARRAFRWE
jgi:ABC-2 type transport system permease protein